MTKHDKIILDQKKSMQKELIELRRLNKKMKDAFVFLWKLDFQNSGQYTYSVRANCLKFIDEKIVNEFLKEKSKNEK